MSIKYVNIQGQKKIKLDKIQFMNCYDIESALQEANLKLPEGIDIFDLFEGAENGSYEHLDFDFCAEFEMDNDDGYHYTEREIKIYQAYKVLQFFFKNYTDLVDLDNVYIYICW